MTDFDALKVAIMLTQSPMAIRTIKRQSLPDGIGVLLKVASGDSTATADAQKVIPKTEAELRAAAEFFIEQVLLSRTSNSYRILGHNNNANSADLRRHMALLMKWLHPDTIASTGLIGEINRSVFAQRITYAWENLKTPDRRAAYDRSLEESLRKVYLEKQTKPKRLAEKKRKFGKLTLFPIPREGLVRKALNLLRCL